MILKRIASIGIVIVLALALGLTPDWAEAAPRGKKPAAPRKGASAPRTASPAAQQKNPAPPKSNWQKVAVFPDWKGRTDSSLAMNSMVSFHFWHGQGRLFLNLAPGVRSLNVFVNGRAFDTSGMSGGGSYALDFSSVARDGINTLQVSNITPLGLQKAVTVSIPYPVIMKGDLKGSGIRPEALALISDIISSDIAHGFPSAQLAVARNGRMVYENAWGKLNSYNQDGTPKKNSPNVTTETLYDLASITKMFSVNYALQKLVTDGKLDVNARVADLLGKNFVADTLQIDYNYEGGKFPGMKTMQDWKAGLTVRDVLCHQAGFPADPQYHNRSFDQAKRKGDPNAVNVLYSGSDGSEATRQATLRAIFKTPLMYKPGTKTVYSDADYILLGFIVEKLTGKRMDVYLRDTFWRPMGLRRIAFSPLENGFTADDCAATELNGNTYDGRISYPNIRKQTLQGQVHDGKAHYAMGGVAGHAGLFSSASDLVRLASVMLTGGYGDHRFFSPNVMDLFTAPKSAAMGNWGLGWWREGDDQRPWYFGTQAPSNTIGHQGWTGTVAMIDPSRQLVLAYLTNKINSPVTSMKRRNPFAGNWYTASTLGFVPQILSIGMDGNQDVSAQLTALLADMAEGSVKLIPNGAGSSHPAVRNARSKLALLRDRARNAGAGQYQAIVDELSRKLPQ